MKQNQEFDNLVGRKIISWTATEMSVTEDDPIVWADHSCGFLQFFDLEVEFTDNIKTLFYSKLDREGDFFGLYIDESALPLKKFEATGDDILRCRFINDFPVGVIEDIKKQLDNNGQVVGVTLTISGMLVVLSCGEATLRRKIFDIIKPQDFILAEIQTKPIKT